MIRRTGHGQVGFDVPVSGFRTGSLHTQSDDGIRVGSKLQCRIDDTYKLRHIHHDVVARSDYDIRFRIEFLDFPAYISDARSRVSATRFQKYMVFGNFRQLLLYNIRITSGGHNPKILGRAYPTETVHCQLQQSFPASQHINELFRIFRGTHRPKPTAYSSSHDNYVIIIYIHVAFIYIYANITKYLYANEEKNLILYFNSTGNGKRVPERFFIPPEVNQTDGNLIFVQETLLSDHETLPLYTDNCRFRLQRRSWYSGRYQGHFGPGGLCCQCHYSHYRTEYVRSHGHSSGSARIRKGPD